MKITTEIPNKVYEKIKEKTEKIYGKNFATEEIIAEMAAQIITAEIYKTYPEEFLK